jgi:ABC-type nitrate/sulfonate/bicarbonate transport system permease component
MSTAPHELIIPDGQRSNNRVRQGLLNAVRHLWLIALLAVIWEVGSRVTGSAFVPPISLILAQFVSDWTPFTKDGARNLAANAIPTLFHMLSGWAIAGAVGITFGLLLGRIRMLEMLFKPLVTFGMNVPPPTLLPLAIMLFGFSFEGMLALIAFGSVWPVLFNTLDAARNLDVSFIASSRVLHFSRWHFFTRVLLPACLPRIITGLRVAFSLALILTVITEMYGATGGIGKTIVSAQRSFQILEMWSGIVILAVLGVVVNRVFLLIEQRLLRWQLGWKQVQN